MLPIKMTIMIIVETSAGEQTKKMRRRGDEERGRGSDEMKNKIKHRVTEEVGWKYRDGGSHGETSGGTIAGEGKRRSNDEDEAQR
jgi:hypothetical protein